ncbi:unnamed protein product [Vitrella brassicaformis CCMP3155]|uniref:Secreted protein n=1 Tax=Vitrella brassicaformis (strain CCMP3155) TaxID=1169540 RepID=A0A0G4GG01_VITBC|nr:unnamed protein product [Vitrella brassicaformis CCMP3155]|eukprot:CEM28291.1 unnamed protein product [Vitrella brassicaformis CCMP3155]
MLLSLSAGRDLIFPFFVLSLQQCAEVNSVPPRPNNSRQSAGGRLHPHHQARLSSQRLHSRCGRSKS